MLSKLEANKRVQKTANYFNDNQGWSSRQKNFFACELSSPGAETRKRKLPLNLKNNNQLKIFLWVWLLATLKLFYIVLLTYIVTLRNETSHFSTYEVTSESVVMKSVFHRTDWCFFGYILPIFRARLRRAMFLFDFFLFEHVLLFMYSTILYKNHRISFRKVKV